MSKLALLGGTREIPKQNEQLFRWPIATPEMEEAVRDVSDRMYEMAMGGQAMPERDRYGGWTGKQFEATGFFRTQHDGERWWLVTPEGNAFLSLGINHYHAHWWMQEYNRETRERDFEPGRPLRVRPAVRRLRASGD